MSIRLHKLHTALDQTAYWPRAWGLIWSAAPRQTVTWSMLLLLQGLLPVGSVIAAKLLVDSVVQASQSGGAPEDVLRALQLVALNAALLLGMEVVRGAIEWTRTAQAELVQDHIKGLVHAQSTRVDLAFYESSDYFDKLEQSRSEAATRPLALLESIGSLVQNGITLLAMAAILLPYGPWLPLVLVLSTAPALFVSARFDKRYYQWWQDTTSARRWTQYYDGLLTQAPPAAELRLFSLGDHFAAAYQALRGRQRTERLDLMRSQTLARIAASAAGLVISGLMLGWMVIQALQGFATLGDLVLLYQAFQRGQGLMRTLLSSLGQVYANTLFLGNLFAFLDLKPGITAPPRPASVPERLHDGIRFRNVTFFYPGAPGPALRNFNLHIPANRIVAVVGANGAGKTTLIKLLCRFYDPQEGTIELDGVDIRAFSLEELRRRISMLFQFPLFFLATAHESIALGDLPANPTRAQTEAAARGAGAHEFTTRLPRGYDTLLGKWFGEGTELSGGQWQRIAMARAYLRQAPIILLDEPTSFMDSWAEADWFKHFRALAEGRTGLIITHRFTIAMRADIIHVVDDGQIVESGTHHQLLEHDGLYASSWTLQMQASGALFSPAELSA
jgi:ATP-binding cassette subfamily B protein